LVISGLVAWVLAVLGLGLRDGWSLALARCVMMAGGAAKKRRKISKIVLQPSVFVGRGLIF